MLLSISSLLSARGACTILSLSVCLLSITVIARPVDQALLVEHDLTAPPTKTYHPNILLRQFIDTKKKSTDKVAFCIARKLVHGSFNPLRRYSDIELGQLHFKDKVEGDQALYRAQRYATEHHSHLESGDKPYWHYLNDVLMYLSREYRAVGEVTVVLDKWLSSRPDLISVTAQTQCKDCSDCLISTYLFISESWIGLIVYRDVTPNAQDHPRPNGKVSLRIGDALFISPKRKGESTAFEDPLFVPIGSLDKDVKVDFTALGQYATKHTEFLDDKSSDGTKWLSDFKQKEKEIKARVYDEGRSRKVAGTKDYFGEWLYTDGIMDGLWIQNAITRSSLENWTKKRKQYLGYYVNHLHDRRAMAAIKPSVDHCSNIVEMVLLVYQEGENAWVNHKCLGKICFFGDLKQPISLMSSLSSHHRMLVPLETLIPPKVYGSKPNMVVSIRRVKDQRINAVLAGLDFCIITPFDSQRAEIEKQLKAERLPWEKVFNVDSFQGKFLSF
ncbi:hypothetical protein FB446DRAFT_704063 [Lentinula raphanica]|nr:hypothetical protein FB446DRAFT_704063 [Lentinula raphanica]